MSSLNIVIVIVIIIVIVFIIIVFIIIVFIIIILLFPSSLPWLVETATAVFLVEAWNVML